MISKYNFFIFNNKYGKCLLLVRNVENDRAVHGEWEMTEVGKISVVKMLYTAVRQDSFELVTFEQRPRGALGVSSMRLWGAHFRIRKNKSEGSGSEMCLKEEK